MNVQLVGNLYCSKRFYFQQIGENASKLQARHEDCSINELNDQADRQKRLTKVIS